MPALSVPVLRALSVVTLVVRWRLATPMPSSACRRNWVAVTFLVLPSALRMAPPSLKTLTWVALRLPTVMSPWARKRALLPVALTVAEPCMASAPATAFKPMVPAVAVVMSTPVPSVKSAAAFNVMCPVPLTMSLLTTK